MRVAPLHGRDQLGDDVRRRRPVGVAHAEVDNVFTAAARRHLELGGDVENVWREALDAREQHWIGGSHAGLLRVSARNRPSDVEAAEVIILAELCTYRNAQNDRPALIFVWTAYELRMNLA